MVNESVLSLLSVWEPIFPQDNLLSEKHSTYLEQDDHHDPALNAEFSATGELVSVGAFTVTEFLISEVTEIETNSASFFPEKRTGERAAFCPWKEVKFSEKDLVIKEENPGNFG